MDIVENSIVLISRRQIERAALILELTKSIDEAVTSDAESLYMEIISRAEKRPEKEITEVVDTVEEILEEVSQEDTSI